MNGDPVKKVIDQYLYYIIIALISVVVLAIFPLFGTELPIEFAFPKTAIGWAIYVLSKLIVAILNLLIFHSFMCQAKVNIRDNPNFIEANEILHKIKEKVKVPESPEKWNAKQYGKKGTTIFISSVLSAAVLGEALLNYDYMALIAYGITIFIGIVFGIINMKHAEIYWTGEYYEYALLRQREEKEKEENDRKNLSTSTGFDDEHQGRSGCNSELQHNDTSPAEVILEGQRVNDSTDSRDN